MFGEIVYSSYPGELFVKIVYSSYPGELLLENCLFKLPKRIVWENCLFKLPRRIVWERDFIDVIKYVLNKQAISPFQLSEVDSIKELCKVRDGVIFSDLSKPDIQILIDVICVS